jgi:hypothetical protein
MPNKQKISIAFLIIAVVIASVFIFVNNDTNEVSEKSVANFSIPAETAQSNWDTYTNTEFGFEFIYPSTWNVSDYDPSTQGIVLSKQTESVGFFTIGKSYVILYPIGKPGSGVPSLRFGGDNSLVLKESINPSTVVRLSDGEITALHITFKNPPQKNTNLEIYAGIKAHDVEYVCVSDITGKEIDQFACGSGPSEPDEESGTYQISGVLDKEEEMAVYTVLKSFSFLR